MTGLLSVKTSRPRGPRRSITSQPSVYLLRSTCCLYSTLPYPLYHTASRGRRNTTITRSRIATLDLHPFRPTLVQGQDSQGSMAAVYQQQQAYQTQQQPPRSILPKSHVGFDSITNQIEKKLIKRGFQFNVICVGKCCDLLPS